MLTETTITKLREMRLSVMANALKDQLEDSQYNSMAFEDRLGLIVDAEWNARKSNHLQRLIRQASCPTPFWLMRSATALFMMHTRSSLTVKSPCGSARA